MIWSHPLMSIAVIAMTLIAAIANDIRWYRQFYGPFLMLMLSLVIAGVGSMLLLNAGSRWMELQAIVGVAWGLASSVVWTVRLIRQEWRRW